MSPAEVKSEAIRWLIEIESEDPSRQLQLDFSDWLDRNPDSRDAYAQAARVWRMLDELGSLYRMGASLRSKQGLPICPDTQPQPRVRFFRPLVVAVAIAAIAITVVLLIRAP